MSRTDGSEEVLEGLISTDGVTEVGVTISDGVTSDVDSCDGEGFT